MSRRTVETGITPETAPPGARLLIKPHGISVEDLSEITILEWAPSGRAVRVRWLSGAQTWETGLIAYGAVVERLPPIAIAVARDIDEDLDAALKRIHEKYGNDFPAFFRDALAEYRGNLERMKQ